MSKKREHVKVVRQENGHLFYYRRPADLAKKKERAREAYREQCKQEGGEPSWFSDLSAPASEER